MNALKTNLLASVILAFSFVQLSATNLCVDPANTTDLSCYEEMAAPVMEGPGDKIEIQVGSIVEGRVVPKNKKMVAKVKGNLNFELENLEKFNVKPGNVVQFKVTALPKGGQAGMGEVTVIII